MACTTRANYRPTCRRQRWPWTKWLTDQVLAFAGRPVARWRNGRSGQYAGVPSARLVGEPRLDLPHRRMQSPRQDASSCHSSPPTHGPANDRAGPLLASLDWLGPPRTVDGSEFFAGLRRCPLDEHERHNCLVHRLPRVVQDHDAVKARILSAGVPHRYLFSLSLFLGGSPSPSICHALP